MMRLPRTLPTLGTVLKWIGIATVVAGLLWYALFQARLLIAGPILTLEAPRTPNQSERVIEVVGSARNVSAITLNDRPIFTDEEGYFRERVILEHGYTIMTVRAIDRYGRTVVLEQPLVYTPAYH